MSQNGCQRVREESLWDTTSRQRFHVFARETRQDLLVAEDAKIGSKWLSG